MNVRINVAISMQTNLFTYQLSVNVNLYIYLSLHIFLNRNLSIIKNKSLTGSVPGIAASNNETLVFTGTPNSVPA
jgi:hypothetical protein